VVVSFAFELLGALDDRDQVDPGRFVDLDQALIAVSLAVLDQLLGAGKLLAVLGQERLVGEERRTGQARVRVRAGLLQRQPAPPVRQRLASRGKFAPWPTPRPTAPRLCRAARPRRGC
jgi:hypothetical protein